MEREVEIDWKCQKKEYCNHIRPEMKSPKFLVHLPMKDFWKEEIGKCKSKEKAGTSENGLADVTFGKVCMLPCERGPVRMKRDNTERKQAYR